MDTIEVADATKLPLDSCSVHLNVTSPPYNVDMEYADDPTNDHLSNDAYMDFTSKWMAESKRVLVKGGRMAINVANTGRKPYTTLNAMVVSIAKELDLLMRGEIIWFKGEAVVATKTAWGSWRDAKNPVTRDCHEYLLCFSKDDYALDCSGFKEPDITRDEFLAFTKSVWEIPPSKRRDHPATFPDDLPDRLIKLYTRPGMVVLDQFCGSGTTCRVAKRLGRHFVGFDRSPAYVRLARSSMGGNLFA